jgi:hypothetical protein
MRASHAKGLAPVEARDESQPNVVADVETVILEPALGCLTVNTVALDGQPRSLTSCAAERLANLELATDTGALGVNRTATAKADFAL